MCEEGEEDPLWLWPEAGDTQSRILILSTWSKNVCSRLAGRFVVYGMGTSECALSALVSSGR